MTDTDSPLVSVVIPTYGRNEYLTDAVESVLNQTYSNIELLIVDDASPVPIEETLGAVSFDPIRSVQFIRHEENAGANVARSSGIEAASGDYVAFLDDDDYWMETKLEKQVKAFETAGPEVGVVYVGKRVENERGYNDTIVEWEGEVVTDLLLGRNFNQFSSIMVRASVIEAAGLPDDRFPSWQDREWFFRLAQHCQFKPVPEPLTVRRTGHENRIGRRFEEKRDVTYPLFVKQYLPLAEEYGPYYTGTFLASLRLALAKSALATGNYQEGRRYLILAFAANPLYRPVYSYLLASLGGKWTYKPIQVAKRAIERLVG